MVWKKLKGLFGGGKDEPPPPPKDPSGPPAIEWMTDSPWGVPVLDLRPTALGLLATSKDPQMAANAMSYGGDDGASFVDQAPKTNTVIDSELRFHIDRVLVEGALFLPRAMDDKWALYYRGGRLLCVRSWQREVMVSAPVRIDGSEAVIGPFTGTLVGEPPHMTAPYVAFLVRAHALGDVVPAPLEREPDDRHTIGIAMFQLWGRNALYATHHPLPASDARRPLRTDSLVHIAVARGDRAEIEHQLAAGVPFDVLARDGLGLPHWALGSRDEAMLGWLLERGCPTDVRSSEGATALMIAVQERSLPNVRLLVEHGADVNAADARGFTSLHRAAEMGELAIAKVLLERGARHDAVAAGKTPRDLAELRSESELVALLSR